MRILLFLLLMAGIGVVLAFHYLSFWEIWSVIL